MEESKNYLKYRVISSLSKSELDMFENPNKPKIREKDSPSPRKRTEPIKDMSPTLVQCTNTSVFGNESLDKNQILTITFKDTLKDSPKEAWDASEAKNGKVKAWIINNQDLYIAAEGKVQAPKSSSWLFFNFANCTNIEFGTVFDTSNVTDMSGMFSHCRSLLNLEVSKFNTSKVTNMKSMFAFCKCLVNADVHMFDTSNVMDMSGMFDYCSCLSNIDVSSFDTSKVTNMSNMFRGCEKLSNLDVSSFDTSQVTNMSSMFEGCRMSNIDVSSFDTSQVTDMSHMFEHFWGLKKIDLHNFDTSQVTNMSGMFKGCTMSNVDVSSFDTSQVTDMSHMFEQCGNLKKIDLHNFNTSKVTDMSHMFKWCFRLWRKPVITVPEGADVTDMFSETHWGEDSLLGILKEKFAKK